MGSARVASLEEASTARANICAVSKRCAGQGCLQRSIAVILLCRFSGCAPTWRTGYQLDPFVAHAWVEVNGKPVTEPNVVASFSVVLEVRPHSLCAPSEHIIER